MIAEAFSANGGSAFVELLIWAVVCGGVGRLIGNAKHRPGEGTAWGLILGPVGWLVMALRAPNYDPETKVCPWCAERVKINASVCRHCGRDIAPPAPPPSMSVAGTRACPSCGGPIHPQATVCNHCRQPVAP